MTETMICPICQSNSVFCNFCCSWVQF